MAEVKIVSKPEDYPNNSYTHRAAQEDAPKVEPVVKGKVNVQKETIGQKFKKLVMPGDIREARKYAVNQILIPGLKNGVISIIEMLFFGQVSGRFLQNGRPGQVNRNNQTNYSYISSNGARINQGLSMPRNQRESFSFQSITFETYDDASDVVEAMLDIYDRQGYVTVGDFYTLCGIQTEFPDFDWGWKRLNKLEPRRLRDCYCIDMTPPVYLK